MTALSSTAPWLGRTGTLLDGIGNTPLIEVSGVRRIFHVKQALDRAQRHPELATVVTLFCDEGEKYFDSHFADREATDLDPSSTQLDVDK